VKGRRHACLEAKVLRHQRKRESKHEQHGYEQQRHIISVRPPSG
jgi:hypothetical protein